MISNHYAMTFGAKYNWLVLIAMTAAGALIRVYFVSRHFAHERGARAPVLPAALAALLLAGVIVALSPSRANGLTASAKRKIGSRAVRRGAGDRREAMCGLPHGGADSGRRQCTACGRATRCAGFHPASHRPHGEAVGDARDAGRERHGNDRRGAGGSARLDSKWRPSLSSQSGLQVHRGEVLHFLADPGADAAPESFEHFPDGVLIIRDGRIEAAGPADALLAKLPAATPVTAHPDCILMPGFIDTHIHYPQVDVIASGGRELLDWLQDYTFPEEGRFADFAHASTVAEVFLDELMRNGTTTALVFCTVHSPSVDAFFQAAQRRGLRMIAGKVLMDRNCPAYLAEPAEVGERATRELIERWHGRERASRMPLPRASPPRRPTRSWPAQGGSPGNIPIPTSTVIWPRIATRSPGCASCSLRRAPIWTSTTASGLVRDRAVYAHCLHMDAADRLRMAQAGASASFCPTSNLFLGSGLFDLAATDAARLRFAFGTDVGGGTSFSMLRTMADAYKVAQLSGQRLSPLRAFYLATLGAARCLGLEGRIGQFVPGAEADFIALDRRATPLIARRAGNARSLADLLLILMTLGDERVVRATHVVGPPLAWR